MLLTVSTVTATDFYYMRFVNQSAITLYVRYVSSLGSYSGASASGVLTIAPGASGIKGGWYYTTGASGGVATYYWSTNNGSSGLVQQVSLSIGPSFQSDPAQYFTNTYYMTATGSSQNEYKSCQKNNDPTQSGLAKWYSNGTLVFSKVLKPGEEYCHTYANVLNTDTLNWTVSYANPIGELQNDGTYQVITDIKEVSYGSATNITGPGTNYSYTYPNPIPGTSYQSNVINFAGGGGGATENTLAQGINALLDSDRQTRAVISGLSITSAPSSGSMGTNSFESWTNGLTAAQLDAMNTNAFNSLGTKQSTLATDTQTKMLADPAYTQIAEGANNYSAAIGLGNPTLPADSAGGGGGGLSIPIGLGVTMDLGSAAEGYPFASTIRISLIWIILFLLFMKVRGEMSSALTSAFLTPQASTAGETVLGNNLNAASALVMAGIVVAAIFTVFAGLSGFAIGAGGALAGAATPSSMWGSLGWGASFAGTLVPITYLVTAALSYAAFCVIKDGILTLCSTIIKFATGL